jgi:hypothetical protein
MMQAFQSCAVVASINHVFIIQCSYGALSFGPLLAIAFLIVNTTVRGGAVFLIESRSLKNERKYLKYGEFWNHTTIV